MNITIGLALLVVCATVYALIKRYETRLVLLTAGLVMTLIAMDPMAAFKQFDKSMTNGSLIIAICSALGFAGVISLTGCDRHLVRLLTKPLGKLGIFLLPACILVGFVVATAIPSMAGMSAAVGPTLIPLLVRAGFRPAMAAAAVASCVMAGYFNPGVSHNPFIAKLAGMEVMEFVGGYANVTFMVCGCLVVLMTGVCVAYGDFKKGGFEDAAQTEEEHQDEKVNVLCALAPLVPVALLLGFSFYIPSVKISVATAMLIGMMYAMLVTRADPVAEEPGEDGKDRLAEVERHDAKANGLADALGRREEVDEGHHVGKRRPEAEPEHEGGAHHGALGGDERHDGKGRRGEQEREHDHVPLEHDLEEERRHEAHDERGRREAPEHPADFGGRKPHARGVDRDEQVADLPGDRDDDRGDEHGAHRAVAQKVRG